MDVQTIAYKIIVKVILAKGRCNILLEKMMQDKNLTMTTKQLVEIIVFNTLKNQIYLDYILKQMCLRLQVSNDIPIELAIFLWMVIYEIYFLEVNNRSLFIKEKLIMVKEINKDLVAITKQLLELCLREFPSEFNLEQERRLTVKLIKYSYPQWLYRLVKSKFSGNIALQLMKDNLKQPLISFRVNTLKTTVEQVLNYVQYQSFNFQPSKIVSDGFISSKSIFNTKLYKYGKIIKQDQASMLVSHIFVPKLYDEIWDMCAGIGAKTDPIAALMLNKGTMIIASDINNERLKIAHQYLMKLGVNNTKLINCDATSADFAQKFDRILLDAPSTASGLIKSKPEIKLINWTKEQINNLITIIRKSIYPIKTSMNISICNLYF